MFKIESYVTPILLSYVDKYVRDFKPADAQVSLWGGGVVLHNLVLKADVLQQEVSLPFTLVSGRIHELLIQVPWTKIMSEPIIVTIDTIECVLSLNPPVSTDETAPPESPSRKTQLVEAPPGYMQALVRRIVSNIALRIHHLIVKYVQDDIVMSLNVKHLAVDSAGANWEPTFADIDQNLPLIRRLVRLDDFTLCLDRADSDGKIRFYQEPLLYRCQLDLRVLTRLVSANTRRASSLSVQLRSTRLAWGVTSDQLTLLLRLTRERNPEETKAPPPAPKTVNVTQAPPIHTSSSNSAEPARSESWSEWAWSWMPAWIDREGGVEEALLPPTPTPVNFTAYFDDVSFVFKVMEFEGNTRKRARVVLELTASHAAVKSAICSPTTMNLKFGTRDLKLCSHGKCVCGYLDYCGCLILIYLDRIKLSSRVDTIKYAYNEFDSLKNEQLDPGLPEEPSTEPQEIREESDELWHVMEPLIYLEYNHDRAPPDDYINPYDNPPKDYEYSDWSEECNLKVQIQPMEIRICMGLVHRLSALKSIYQELPPVPEPELPMRILTVEECDALSDNLPQRRVSVEAKGLRIRTLPWEHSPNERANRPPVVLDVELPKSLIIVNGPLYPHRVCSAACQMPDDAGPLWQGARLHVSASFHSIQVRICSPCDEQPRPCARADVRFVTHLLLNKEYFNKRESVVFSYSIKIREANVCGSSARLQAAWQIPLSLLTGKPSLLLKYTMLAKDALTDEEAVAVDVTIEDLSVRGYMTRHINTHIISLQTAKATTLQETRGVDLKQAWLFAGPDTPTTTPYLRAAIQWCSEPVPISLDYVGIWMEQTAICVDPLFIAWLAYKPAVKPYESQLTLGVQKGVSSTQYFTRRRPTPPSSSGRGATRTGSGADMVHSRTRSAGSSSEPSERKDKQPQQQTKPVEDWWTNERLLAFHERLKRMLVNIEVGLVLAYVTLTTATALDSATVRDAMERHAINSQRVLSLSFGRLSMHSSSNTKHLWHDIRHDGPTFVEPKTDPNQPETDSFPWKMRIADMSCYTLEVRASRSFGRETSGGGLHSQLKMPCSVTPRTILDLVSTSVTLSVVTKAVQFKAPMHKETKKHTESTVDEDKLKYFKTGMDFKPSTLKEFVRGPRSTNEEFKPEPAPVMMTSGPVVSLGVHLHADTPPLILRLDHEQVHIVSATLHCFNHILTLLQRQPLVLPKGYTTLGGSHRSLIRSVSEIEEIQSQSEDTQSENRSDLVPIFQSHSAAEIPHKLKTFFWFQWVVSRTTVFVTTPEAKLAFDIDDIISTVDLQSHYNQLKIKVASASVRHYERVGIDEWAAGVLSGRVLEAREPTDAKEENHFLAITITQAQISNLPASWKEELHPKLLEQKNIVDSMWEIYATLAPLEMVLQPTVLEHIMTLMREFVPRSFCPLQAEANEGISTWQWPFLYVTAGGLRLLMTCEDEDQVADDTFMFVIGKVTVNPHPENPICRRAINTGPDSGWLAAGGGYEGRQYEILVKNVGIRSAQFKQLVNQETSEVEMLKGTGGENPALKWTQPVVSPVITPILHSVDIGCVLAPALYLGGALASGPAVELNLLSDCAIELSIEHLDLLRRLMGDITEAVKNSNSSVMAFSEESHGVCPYATVLMAKHGHDADQALDPLNETPVIEETSNYEGIDIGKSLGADSGIETSSFFKSSRFVESSSIGIKKSVSIALGEQMAEASEYLEVYVTMGMIELSLYTVDDNSPEVIALRPPKTELSPTPEKYVQQPTERDKETVPPRDEDMTDSLRGSRSKSLSDNIRIADMAKSKLEFCTIFAHARKNDGNLPLVHVSLQQPNLYYWRKKSQKSLQVSLFNAWMGLGVGVIEGNWHAALLTTAKGSPDPVTEIPPALATMKIVGPSGTGYYQSNSSTATKGTIRLDIERPVLIEVCTDRIRRIKNIIELLSSKIILTSRMTLALFIFSPPRWLLLRSSSPYSKTHQGLESITVQTSQIGVCGSEGTVGWDGASVQVTLANRPDRLSARGAIIALLVAAGPPGDRRHVLLHPLMLGMGLEATWEAWRRAEGGLQAREPTVRVGLEVDRVIFDLRPTDLATLNRIKKAIDIIARKENSPPPAPTNSTDTIYCTRSNHPTRLTNVSNGRKSSSASLDTQDANDHYYKDDLRSGAFKIISGGQLPMAYQVMLHGSSVSWRYPHPRAITRLVAFPMPGLDQEVECVLELYSPMLGNWEQHTYFNLPVREPKELHLYAAPPDAVFAQMWRFRARGTNEAQDTPYEFDITRFMPKSEPTITDQPETTGARYVCGVTAEQLSGVLRVDSYFTPRQLPLTRVVLRVAALEIHAHNSIPFLSSQVTALEGYYVSRPLMRSHRVLSIIARDITGHAQLGSSAGCLLLADGNLSADIMDCATGTMEQLVDEFRFQSGVAVTNRSLCENPRTRVAASKVHVALHVPRLRTLHSLAADWISALDEYIKSSVSTSTFEVPEKVQTKREVAAATAAALEGRVSLWIHNSCAAALRVGQEQTDEVVPLGPGARLAYRWRSPNAAKRLRFALAGPTTDWHWSTSIPFAAGTNRVRLEDAETLGSGKQSPGAGVFLYTKVEEDGARRSLHLAGRLALASMLRFNLLYKVRARCSESNLWRTVCSGELASETVGRSVVCGTDCEMVLKIKFTTHDTGWSGDIPLKECPKENVPWLVKVPSEGDVPYMSVWCRVVRGRIDGRILSTVWPLYVLHSHLPLDIDVLIATNTGVSSPELGAEQINPPPRIQTAPGRGTSTHLLAPGTTAARHSLSFQYRNIECPVTREAVLLHYGVTDTSVFDKRTPIASIEQVIDDILLWLAQSGRNAVSAWPYSIVSKHWGGQWQPALLQPRCDVTVRYRAVRAGGGCSLEVQLCPTVLLCNAAPIALTLRANDAAPLCKLEPGSAISPPSIVLKKPFFMSVEMGRETFVSGQLQLCAEEPGRYGEPPPGQVALDRSADFAIQCNHKVALLTMYYEIKESINVLGVSSTYVLINRLDTDILVSAVAMPSDIEEELFLRSKSFKVVTPTKEGSIQGVSLCKFWLRGRWRGGDPSELSMFLSVALPAGTYPATQPVPVRLGAVPTRRAIALADVNKLSVPVVVTQIKHEGRLMVVVAKDPCPQFVVHNRTKGPLAVAQPVHTGDDPSSSKVAAVLECSGTNWWCIVQPQTMTHYSTPAHCARYPPQTATSSKPFLPFLIFAKAAEGVQPEWCPPVAITDGEQLLQLRGGATIKLCVRTHPHSTHLELQDVDQHDISASDIRRRLFKAFNSEISIQSAVGDETRGGCNPDGQIPYHLDVAYFATFPRLRLLPGEWTEDNVFSQAERLRCVVAGVAVEMSASADALPLLALHVDRAALLLISDPKRTKTILSIADIQIDNLQYESGQYDFAVIASTRAEPLATDRWPPLWSLFCEKETFASRQSEARVLLTAGHDKWTVMDHSYKELTEVEIRVGPLALYVEDAYVTALVRLSRLAAPAPVPDDAAHALAEERSLQAPVRLRTLHIHPLDLTLTLHTAIRMYIALDQSPLRLSAFKLNDMMTSTERLTHALTVHYLSAAILGAGWVVGGLELLGAPGALAARVGGATGGVRGVASAAAAALLRSLSAWAGSLARNLDLLAGDEEHARRAAAARRRPPPSLVAGLVAGITNFAINVLGAVGGLAHHPLVGVAVGESGGGAAALRRGLVGALAKPLSATADLLAYAGHGLLTQTGWDPVPQPRSSWPSIEARTSSGWRRDCVRWTFKLAELTALSGFEVLLDNAPLQLLLTHKFLVVADPETERIVEMIDFKFCNLAPFQGRVIELCVTQKRQPKISESRAVDEDDEYQISAAAMARVARYTGAEGTPGAEARTLSLLPIPAQAHALHAGLAAAIHNNADSHFPLL
ncbi:hypothetical protein K1T71_000033 [Dendrolimus kikuchii]|uniref:Uncharacterized protein n=1 Tax=Dendrolimus kikuchii TaxID=765133 RepID=A0ACC1DII5_9NEOP|nr:hypothetical protein K1T71_000033 [Dendrolimus kikuchii]